MSEGFQFKYWKVEGGGQKEHPHVIEQPRGKFPKKRIVLNYEEI